MSVLNSVVNFTPPSAPREEGCLLLESLSESVSEIAELFRSSNMAPGSEIPEWNVLAKRKVVGYRNYLSTNTLGIWTSCRGLFPSFRAWLRFKILKKNHDTVVNRIFLPINQQFLFHLMNANLTWPLITLICFSNINRSKPLSVWKMKFQDDCSNRVRKYNFYWPRRVCEGHRRYPGQSSCHSTCPTPGPLSHGRTAPTKDYSIMTLHTTTLSNNLGSR